MRLQMPDELESFHEARTNGSFVTVCPVNDLSASSRFASSTNATASWRFSRASSSVVPWVFAPGSSSTKAISLGHLDEDRSELHQILPSDTA